MFTQQELERFRSDEKFREECEKFDFDNATLEDCIKEIMKGNALITYDLLDTKMAGNNEKEPCEVYMEIRRKKGMED